jgi:hypothetical protein
LIDHQEHEATRRKTIADKKRLLHLRALIVLHGSNRINLLQEECNTSEVIQLRIIPGCQEVKQMRLDPEPISLFQEHLPHHHRPDHAHNWWEMTFGWPSKIIAPGC